MKRYVFSLLACFMLVLFLVSCQPTQEEAIITPDYPSYSTVDEAVKASDLIVEGNVLSKEYKMLDVSHEDRSDDPQRNPGGTNQSSPDLPYTIYEIEVSKVYKGDVTKGDIVEIKIIGGEFKDVQYVVSEPIPQLDSQNQYTLFLTTFENSPASPINLMDSIFTFTDGYLKSIGSESLVKRFSVDELLELSD